MSLRRILDNVSIAGLLLIAWITVQALYGPESLATRIATHFDAAGNANGWGPRGALLGLPIAAILLYTLMTVVARYPTVFNFPVRVTPRTRPRLEALALDMTAWLKAEIVWLFAWIQHVTIEFARTGRNSLSPFFMPVVLAVVLITVVGYVIAMQRVGRG